MVFAQIKFTSPVSLKVDVQGYESRALVGAEKTLSRIDFAVIETSFTPMYEGEADFRDILGIMEGRGFYFARPIDLSTSERNGEIVQMDALFIRR